MKIKRKWLVLSLGDGTIFCHGIFSSVLTAIGKARLEIEEFSNKYQDKNDEFEISKLKKDNHGGFFIEMRFKGKNWENPVTKYYWIVEGEFFDGDE